VREGDSPASASSSLDAAETLDDDFGDALISPRPSSESPVDQRTRIAREILETETYYIQSLNVLIEVHAFLARLLACLLGATPLHLGD